MDANGENAVFSFGTNILEGPSTCIIRPSLSCPPDYIRGTLKQVKDRQILTLAARGSTSKQHRTVGVLGDGNGVRW